MGRKAALKWVLRDMRCACKPGALGIGIYDVDRVSYIAERYGVRERVVRRMVKRAVESSKKASNEPPPETV